MFNVGDTVDYTGHGKWEITSFDNGLYYITCGHTSTVASEFELNWYKRFGSD